MKCIYRMTIKNPEIQADYSNRINRVFNYIDENLESDLSLDVVAGVAFFSPFHFHRIFKIITQETLNDYVKRRRIEKSASDLLHKTITATEVAHKYGFSNISSFSRAFKKHFGISPTKFKKENPNRHTKILNLKSKNGQEYPDNEKYLCIINNLQNWITMNAEIQIIKMPKMDLAYVSSIGSQNLQNAFEQLIHWATPQGLINNQTRMVTVYHDSFKITEADKVRMSASIILQKPIDVEGNVALTSIGEGKFIVARFEIGIHEFEKSWTGLYLWMNENGYKKADKNPFEIYHNNFNEHPDKISIVDFCIPIE